MFDNIPTDVPAKHLSGIAAFVSSDGERTEDMGKNDYIYVLNQVSGIERVPAGDDGRARQKVVPAGEADSDDVLTADDYTNSVFEDEARAWASELLEGREGDDSDDSDDE